MQRFEAWEYYDTVETDTGVWFGKMKKAGYDVPIKDGEELDTKKALKDLKSAGVLDSVDQRKIAVVSGLDIIEIREKKGNKPLVRLVRRYV